MVLPSLLLSKPRAMTLPRGFLMGTSDRRSKFTSLQTASPTGLPAKGTGLNRSPAHPGLLFRGVGSAGALFAIKVSPKSPRYGVAELYVLGMGSPHPALGSLGGNWGTGSPVPPIECRASFLRLMLDLVAMSSKDANG
jgi:hypothetical protein